MCWGPHNELPVGNAAALADLEARLAAAKPTQAVQPAQQAVPAPPPQQLPVPVMEQTRVNGSRDLHEELAPAGSSLLT